MFEWWYIALWVLGVANTLMVTSMANGPVAMSTMAPVTRSVLFLSHILLWPLILAFYLLCFIVAFLYGLLIMLIGRLKR